MTKKHPISADIVPHANQGIVDTQSGGPIHSADTTGGILETERRCRDIEILRQQVLTRLNKTRATTRSIAPDVATAVAFGDRPPTIPGIIASNLKRITKGTLIGTVDLTVPKWRLGIHGCLWHEKNGKQWVSFPAREWTSPDGHKHFANLIEFSERETHDRFHLAAIKLLERNTTP
jgi:hypothetical protein